ncbi:MAG: hypothetical protein ACK5UE_03350 [Chitinophagales bacterium]|jgi:predicted patatin/cPLA2 family phospholipase|nr:hypothetical protein [Sphingobacteriales bacterium]
MIYTVEKAILVTNQLKKFKDSYAFMVAGQFANIDFWMNEVMSGLKAIDEHNMRFEKMYKAQKKWTEEKNVKVPDYCSICNGICELSNKHYIKPELPKNSAKKEKIDSRKELINASYYFLVRCFKLELLDENLFREYCHCIGTSIDPNDFY